MSVRTHTVRIGGSIPALVIRVLLVLVGGGAALLLNPYPLWQGIGIVAVVVGAVFPQTYIAWGSAASIALGILLAEPSPGRTAAALLGIHLVHVLGCLCATIPWRSRVAVRALRPTLRRFLLVEVIAQPIALLAAFLPALGTDGYAWLAPAGAAIVVALAILVLRSERDEKPER